MTQLLTLSRAAQVLGVSRHVLQRQIHDGRLATHEGMVASEDLLRLYPGLEIDDAGGQLQVIPPAGHEFAKSGRERILPPKEMILRRLAKQSEELAEVRRHLARYHDLIEDLQARIEAAARTNPSAPMADLRAVIDDGLAAILGSQDMVDKVEVVDEVLKVVTAHVSVRPSGHEFVVEGAETVLEAAIRAGLAPSYGCGNGNCGLCKARIVEGEVRQVREFDYPLSVAERAQNYTLLCSHTAVTDLVVEMIEALKPADIPEQQIVARVKSVSPLDNRTYLLHLETPRTSRLRFLAGQNVSLGIAGPRLYYRGDFPVASCPCDDRNLLFHVSRSHVEAGNDFAARLFDGEVHSGDTVDVWGPFGEFVLHQDSLRPLLFLGCDTGFAPIKSVIEHALSIDVAPTLALYWGATRPGGHYLARQGRAWAEALDNFSFRALDAADAGTAAEMVAGAVMTDLPDLCDRDIYVAGQPQFVSTLAARLREAGVSDERMTLGEA